MNCVHDPTDASQYYFKVSSRRMRNKEVQIIPWALSDSNSIRCPSPRLDPNRTVFVGGLHGLLNAGEEGGREREGEGGRRGKRRVEEEGRGEVREGEKRRGGKGREERKEERRGEEEGREGGREGR